MKTQSEIAAMRAEADKLAAERFAKSAAELAATPIDPTISVLLEKYERPAKLTFELCARIAKDSF